MSGANTDTVFVSRSGIDSPLCGTDTAPCGTLYQASVLVNAMNATAIETAVITVLDGQNETEIVRHLSAADTGGYDPCLPVPFSVELAIEIVFDALQITVMSDWYPSVCPDTNTIYANEYLFEGGQSLSLRNLVVNDYTITDDSYYPIIKGSFEYFNTSVACHDCVFERIVSSVTNAEKPLIYSRVSLELRNNRWADIACSTSLLWSRVGFISTVDYRNTIRVVAITNSVFTNIDVADYLFAWQPNDGKPTFNITDCTFTSIRSGVSLFRSDNFQDEMSITNTTFDLETGCLGLFFTLFRSDNFQDEMSITNTTFDLETGCLGLFFNYQTSHIYFEDVTITTAQRWFVGAEYGLITIAADSILTMTNVIMRYTYNVTAGCLLYSSDKNLTDGSHWWREWTCMNAYMALLNEGGEVTMRNCELDTILTGVPSYDPSTVNFEFESTVGWGFSALFVNDGAGVLNLENFYHRRGLCRYLFRNQGTMNIFNFTTWYDEAEYNPHIAMSMALFTSWGNTATMFLDASRISGFKRWAAMSFAAGMYISNTVFEMGGWAMISNAGNMISIENCTFTRVGGRYFGQWFSNTVNLQPTVPIYMFRVGKAEIINNRFSTFDSYGLVGSFESGETLISNNIFTLNASGALFELPDDGAVMVEGRSIIMFDGGGPTQVIENVFEVATEDMNYDPNNFWILYDSCSSGYHGICGNTFTNAAIKAIATNVTSCFRPRLIECVNVDTAYSDCFSEKNISLKDVVQQVTVTAEIDSVFHVESGDMALDHVHIEVSTAAEVADPVIVKAVNSTVLLVDSFIADGYDISYYTSECEIVYNERLRDPSEYIAKLHLVCGDVSESDSLQQTSDSDALRLVDSLSASSIDVQSLSSTYYPGQLFKISFTVMDALGNALDYQTTDKLVIRLEGEGFLTDLSVLPSGVCSQCEQGVLINTLQVNEHDDEFTLEVSILNDVLLLLDNQITLNVTGCPAGFGPDENNSTCIHCNNGYYNLLPVSVVECRSCEPGSNTGVECSDGDITVIRDHWMGLYHDNASSSIISALCPTRYCCQQTDGCKYNDALNHAEGVLCAKNRNSSSKLCGACNDGYSEAMNSALCVKCEGHHFEFILWPLLWSVILTLMIFYCSMESGKRNPKKSVDDKKEVVRARPKNICQALLTHRYFQYMIRTMVLKNIFYYQQAVTQILSTSTYNVLFRDLAGYFELTMTSALFDADEDALWCFVDGLGAKGKIVFDLLIPVFVFAMVSGVFVVSRYVVKNESAGCCAATKRIKFGKAYITTFLIVIGSVLDVLFKLMSCQQVGDEYVHYYFGYETCYQVTWWLSFISTVVVVAAFTFIFVHIKNMNEVERQSPSNTWNRMVSRYRAEYWYWEYVLFIRRIVIALFAVSIQSITAKFFFGGILLVVTFVQYTYNPFKVEESNQMEAILLCCLVFIQMTKISPVFNSIAVNITVSFLIVAPFLLLVYYTRRIYQTKIIGNSGNANATQSSIGSFGSSVGPNLDRVTSYSGKDMAMQIELQTSPHQPRVDAGAGSVAGATTDNVTNASNLNDDDGEQP
eukprot:CAMPEP_0202729254 /NCGR_PEP_ID=MMETSP1385-20130828/186035_1 /ASSEMBLY_ACC=CAM_ASM_000861 /TAXON_ID=933848 /ORGANISM="Elphidium margaritaceum" /LENGTH=1552 /DNA_ID=CAMNT_0049395511 /DNA_START=49 /DNA_END=4707 /DNA_ORIENTATION=-